MRWTHGLFGSRRRPAPVPSPEASPAAEPDSTPAPTSLLDRVAFWRREFSRQQREHVPSVDEIQQIEMAMRDQQNAAAVDRMARRIAEYHCWFPGDT